MSKSPNKIPTGFEYFPDFLSADEEIELIKKINELPWQVVKFHGVVAKRKVMHFGLDYNYATRNVIPTNPPPAFLLPFIKRAANLLKLPPSEIAEILITKYPKGAGIGWHVDSPVFGDKVFGISLKSSCVFKLRLNQEQFQTTLTPGSAYIISGSVRNEWQHSIPAVKETRYSITFRSLAAAKD